MLFNSAIAMALLASGAVATMSETTSAMASTSTSTTSSQIQVQVVQVSNANGSLAYFPEEIVAAAGTMVQFQFHPKNHTVTQSSFAEPCIPLLTSTANATSMVKSGFMPVAADATDIPVFTMMINDTKPIWLYCGQTGHCQKGMVMAINVNNSSPKTLAAFKAKAALFNGTTTATTSSNSSSSSSSSSNSGSGSSSSSSGSTDSGASATTSSGTATQTTNGASRPVAGWASLAVMFVAGYAMLL